MKFDLKKINFKQPKYMIPLLVLLPLLFVGYQLIGMFTFEAEPAEDTVVATESVNTDMPMIAENRQTETKSKYQAMLDGFGRVTDYSAVSDAGEEMTEDVRIKSTYKEDEKRRIDSIMAVQNAEAERLKAQFEAQRRQWQQEQAANRNAGQGGGVITRQQADEDARIRDREERQMRQMQQQMKLIQQMADGKPVMTEEDRRQAEVQKAIALEQQRLRDSIAQANRPLPVSKAGDAGEAFFNTVSSDRSNPSLIRARVDRLEKVRDGSRIRLRIDEDIEIEGHLLPRGTYLYATVNGFSAQRVKASVTSVVLGDRIQKIDLSVYDLDGMEGFFVPSSNFREVSKDIAAGSMNMNMNISNGSDMSMESLAMQSLQQALQGTTSAVSKSIKANRARIKYNTQIYLVDNSNQ